MDNSAGINGPGDSRPAGWRRHWRKTWRVGLGSLLVLAGLALIPLPGPGLLIVIAGLAVMADEVPVAHRLMERLKTQAKNVEDKIRRATNP